MHNGFYDKLDKLVNYDKNRVFHSNFDFLHANGNYGQSFIEKMNREKGISVGDFLHGYCFEFAILLNQLYGYPIQCIIDPNNNLIHAYCVYRNNGILYFVDARGTTNNWFEFSKEYSSFATGVNNMGYCFNKIVQFNVAPEYYFGTKVLHNQKVVKAAREIHNKYKHFYNGSFSRNIA